MALEDGDYENRHLEGGTRATLNNEQTLSIELLNSEFARLLNAERATYGLNPVTVGHNLRDGNTNRKLEMLPHNSQTYQNQAHTRPDGTDHSTAFNYMAGFDHYFLENSGVLAYDGNTSKLNSERYLAEQFFTIWKNCQGHYESMMEEGLREIYLGISLSEYMLDQSTGEYHDRHSFIGFLSMKAGW